MPNISIQGTKTESDNLYVTGTVDGRAVTAHGWVSRFNRLDSEARKVLYLETLLRSAASISPEDQALIQKHVHVGIHKRIWRLALDKIGDVLLSSGVFIGGVIARHYLLLHLTQVEHFLHVNLTVLR